MKMDITVIAFLSQCLQAVISQSTIKFSDVSSNNIENRLRALEEEVRRLGQSNTGMLSKQHAQNFILQVEISSILLTLEDHNKIATKI